MATKNDKKQINKKKENNDNLKKSLIELILIIIAVLVILIFFKGTFIWNIVVLLLILSALIFVHEGGHFLMAKKNDVHVYEFALGMGPKVLGFKRKNDPTEYTLRAFPIGGFCAMAGEEGEDDSNLPKDKFMCNKKVGPRILILVAGVVMNFITAFVLLFFISFIWGSTEQSSVIGRIEPGSPASEAGLVVGDKIVGLNGYKVSTWDKITVINSLKNKTGENVYKIEHKDGSVSRVSIKPADYLQTDKLNIRITDEYSKESIIKEYNLKEGEYQVVKLIGIGQNSKVEKGFIRSLKYAFGKLIGIISTMLLIIGSLITGKMGLNALSGPVGMYSVVETVATTGLANVLYLTAYLSINLGVINILPFPAFDGGRVVFVFIEAITKKKVDAKIEGYFHTVGFILLMILMLYITFQDILRLF